MPRQHRFATGGYVFHALNRAAGRQTIFATEGDYAAFQRVLAEAHGIIPMRLLCYAVLPNHWHLVLWPIGDDDLSSYMQWVTVTHTQRWHAAHGTSGTGPLYQGRFKSFPVETDEHFLTLCRYVERNPLRANLVQRAENWRWSSLWQWHSQRCDVTLDAWPVPRPTSWLNDVNTVETEAELAALRHCVSRGAPFGPPDWRIQTARRLGLESTLRGLKRPVE